jgi:hypothetical protein
MRAWLRRWAERVRLGVRRELQEYGVTWFALLVLVVGLVIVACWGLSLRGTTPPRGRSPW